MNVYMRSAFERGGGPWWDWASWLVLRATRSTVTAAPGADRYERAVGAGSDSRGGARPTPHSDPKEVHMGVEIEVGRPKPRGQRG
jgi:hypothetical protein